MIYGVAPDLNVKIAALAARAQALLAAHDADFGRADAVATYLDDAVDARDRSERLALMAAPDGSGGFGPERYAEITYVAEGADVDPLLSGRPLDVRDRFRLYVYWGVRRGTDDFGDEATAFRAALRSRDPDAPGLVTALRLDGHFTYTDDDDQAWEIEVIIEALETTFRLIDRQSREYRHEAALTLSLTGAPL